MVNARRSLVYLAVALMVAGTAFTLWVEYRSCWSLIEYDGRRTGPYGVPRTEGRMLWVNRCTGEAWNRIGSDWRQFRPPS